MTEDNQIWIGSENLRDRVNRRLRLELHRSHIRFHGLHRTRATFDARNMIGHAARTHVVKFRLNDGIGLGNDHPNNGAPSEYISVHDLHITLLGGDALF